MSIAKLIGEVPDGASYAFTSAGECLVMGHDFPAYLLTHDGRRVEIASIMDANRYADLTVAH